ncbi:transcriptional regulator, TetR family protein [Herbaspirillum frisingense GSF30]|uniref:Transcriptional regulator, TetR family protein n=1 Tax=Herbaspirillum frisingense GSF30 TaxID=864073 RepID=A0AAI9ICQ5_9BURK|nr:TetR/AcrR family transcriptional regulator [Herbaspirillum frisingense]EOA03535.1 transcriptional regulator, TetR family protein [Herbaspirillum frisingense GSF30]
MNAADTREIIMGVARKAVQARGYNALSFRELAAEVGIKSASVHYHFPTKGDLAAALAQRYTEDGREFLGTIREGSKSVKAAVQQYTDIFRAALADDNRMCLCGIMSAEHDDLPPEVRAELDRFNQMNVDWLASLLAQGSHGTKELKQARTRALAIFAAIEGAQLIARGQGDIAVYDQIIEGYRQAGLLP